MSTELDHDTLTELKNLLTIRRTHLLADIHEGLLASEEEHYIDLAGKVHDPAEEAVADLLSDVNLAVIDQHVHELREVEAALRRLEEGHYGRCIDCGGPIGLERLRSQPTAVRCIQCQQVYERTHAGAPSPTL
ncbi:MAG TPA: TraR/DksA family transcriptional regulator [Thiotrichales bacterium]|nr:TraR/DksA family transcriptional regulator [Thiotrichales bacterium]